jgi:hypothetical protein
MLEHKDLNRDDDDDENDDKDQKFDLGTCVSTGNNKNNKQQHNTVVIIIQQQQPQNLGHSSHNFKNENEDDSFNNT